jgi:hypothetical protein
MHALALLLFAAPPSVTSGPDTATVQPATPSEADVARARELASRAQVAFDSGDHALTSALLAEAHGLDPQPLYLLGQAQAERLAGHCSVAIPLYERYLATAPPADKAEAARMNLARCRTTTTAPVPPPLVVAREPAPPVVSVATPPRADDRAGDRRARRGAGMIAGGSATLVIGTVATIVGATLFARADRAGSERAFERTLTGSSVGMGVGVAIAGAGAVVLGVGIVRWMKGRDRAER